MGIVKSLGVIGVLAGGVYTYDQIKKHTSFTPVKAEVVAVHDLCIMEKRSGKSREYSNKSIPCEAAEWAVVNRAEWKGFDVVRKTEVTLRYISPADGKSTQTRRLLRGGESIAQIRAGQQLPIRASKTDPKSTREV